MKKHERFFGLHFDFHADNETEVGIRTKPEDIERYIIDAKPDFVQCDSKGHSGNCSYPTKVGKAADKLCADNLKIWADTVKRHNLPLYVHYSGVLDEAYCKANPEYATIKQDGTPTISVNLFCDDYLDNLMIPEIKEMITEYGIDGVWVDGDCWAVERDFSERAKLHLYNGITQEEHNKLMRDEYLRFLKKYTDELHAFAPDFQVISNWMYTSYAPEKPSVAVDCLSGDYFPNNSVHEARYEGRCMALRDMPWDLMAWTFDFTYWTEKPAEQLKQELAMTLSLGGGVQLFIRQNPDGSAPQFLGDRIKEVGDFVHLRRNLYGKKPIAQIGILFDETSYYKKSNIFNAAGATAPLIGVLNAILDAQFTANILYTYQLEQIKDYEVFVVPEWAFLTEETKGVLLNYAKDGGNLVVIGAEVCQQFGNLLNISFGEVCTKSTFLLDEVKGGFAALNNNQEDKKCLDIKTGNGFLYSNYDVRDRYVPSYRIDRCEKGKITYIPFAFGQLYFNAKSYISANFIKKVISALTVPFIRINKKNIDITLQKSDDGLIVNLINMRQGRQELKYLVYDDVPEVYDVEVTINGRYGKIDMPFMEDFEMTTQGNTTVIKINKLSIHSVIVLKN